MADASEAATTEAAALSPTPPTALSPSAKSPRTEAIAGVEAPAEATAAAAAAAAAQAPSEVGAEPSAEVAAAVPAAAAAATSSEGAPTAAEATAAEVTAAEAPTAEAAAAEAPPAEGMSELIFSKLIADNPTEVIGVFFSKYDADGNKHLDKLEIVSIFKDLISHLLEASPTLDPMEREYIMDEVDTYAEAAADDSFSKIDTDHNGTIEMTELTAYAKSGDLLQAALTHSGLTVGDEAKDKAELVALKKSVTIRIHLKSALAGGHSATGDDVTAIFNKFDKDHSHTLDRPELVKMFGELIELLISKLDDYSAEMYDEEERANIAEEAVQSCYRMIKEAAEAADEVVDDTETVGVEQFRAFIVSPNFSKCFSFLVDEEDEGS